LLIISQSDTANEKNLRNCEFGDYISDLSEIIDMLKENGLSLLFIFAFSAIGFAQQELAGKIVKKGGREILIGVSVINLNLKRGNISDMGGNYKIPTLLGDTILFSSAGYQPDTLIVRSYMFSESWLVDLTPNIVALPYANVEEESNYQFDSLKRRDEYRFLLDRKHPVKFMNEKRPGDAPGLNFSPLGYYSKGEKRKRRLKKRLQLEEEDFYIDYKFPPARVARLTQLKGDSLQLFLRIYRPSYAFCRKANSQDMLLYINDKLKLFRKNN
jgi:hypothetical protein